MKESKLRIVKQWLTVPIAVIVIALPLWMLCVVTDPIYKYIIKDGRHARSKNRITI